MGEASPSYIYHLNVAARLLRWMPHMRVFFLLREPIERAISEYVNKRRRAAVASRTSCIHLDLFVVSRIGSSMRNL